MKLRLLHLSDVHFGCKDPDNEQGRITKGIKEALEEYESIDFIIFTGDLSQKATPTEFQQGQDWLSKLAMRFNSRIIICPGNHDVNRNIADVNKLRLASPTEDTFNRLKGEIYSEHEHLKPFLNWFSQAKYDQPRFINNWSSNPFSDLVKTSFGDISIKFACINTATLSCGDDDEGNLAVDISSMNDMLIKCDAKHELIIALAHHPKKEWLIEWNNKKFEVLLQQETGPHLFMHGHLHNEIVDSMYEGTGSGVSTVASGAAYQGSKWIQSFSVIEIDLHEKEILPKIFEYSNDSGKWHDSSKDSRPIPIRIPNIKDLKKSSNEINDNVVPVNNKRSWRNPFDYTAANDIRSREIPQLFVDKNNSINRVSNKTDSIVEGQRGTGKTMLLRYFSIEVQAKMAENFDGSIIEYINKNQPGLGIYSRLSNAGFNRSDTEILDSKERKESLFNHRITVFLISDFFRALDIIVLRDGLDSTSFQLIKRRIRKTLREEDIEESLDWSELKGNVLESCDLKLEALDEHISSLLPGSNPISFNPWLSLSTSFMGLLELVKERLNISVPYFLLFDDFDAFNEVQQMMVFKTASERNHDLVCFKYGIMSLGQKTYKAGRNRTYRDGDDYDLVQLNWIDKGLKSGSKGYGDYSEAVSDIIQKRLVASHWPEDVSFKTLFNPWNHGNKIRKEVQELAKQTYEEKPRNDRPLTFTNYWNKQGNALYFRHLRNKKIEHRYAGPETIVAVSSGIYRQILEVCSRIVTSALDTGWEPNSIKRIGPEIQNTAIRKYSNDMLRSLGETSGDTSSLTNSEFDVNSQHLINFVNSISRFFACKLYSDSKDPEVIAIAIKGKIKDPSFGHSILRVAVRESILQRRTIDYSAKSTEMGRLPTYIFNRRLIPRVDLGVKLQGRHELSIEDIELAATNDEEFLRKFCEKPSKKNNQNPNQGDLL